MSSQEDIQKLEKAVDTCHNLQMMIDISANTLHSLRRSLQSNPSSQASQALREAETKLVKMFSRQLISKSTIAGLKDAPQLTEYPNTEQWLKVVGLPSSTIKGLIAHEVTLDKLLKVPPEKIAEVMAKSGAHQSETVTLNKAVGKLRAWTESQINGGSEKQNELYWTDTYHGSPYSQRSNKPAPPIMGHGSRPTSTSSVSRSSVSSASSDHVHSPTGSHHGGQYGTWNSHTGSLHSQSGGNTYYNTISSHGGPPRSPLAAPSTPTQLKAGRSRPNTPPPQIKNTVFQYPSVSQQVAASPIQKSMSHDSHFHNTITASLDNVPHSASILDDMERASIMSYRSDYSTTARMTPKHKIEHRFETKNFKPGKCDYCKKKMFASARVCRFCKYKCHKECEPNVSVYSCGLSDELLKEATKYMSPNSSFTGYPSPHNSHRGSLTGSLRRNAGIFPDSSSASSCTSSSPSSPLFGAHSDQISPSSGIHFVFPQASLTSRTQLLSDTSSNRSITVEEREKLVSTVSTVDSQDTVIASHGTVDMSNEYMKSEGSDQTVIDSNSSEKTIPDHLESSSNKADSSLDTTHSPMLRQPSLSKALEEWDIPYQELDIEEELGTGHIGTVFRGRWHGPVAIKKIPINPAIDLDAQLLAFKQEIAILKKTRHENIVLFMGACMKPPELAIVTSFVNGETIFLLTRKGVRWNMNKIRSISSQIIQGMGYLHSKDIIHKYLTSKNIFVTGSEKGGEKVVITDFGLHNISRLSTTHSSRGNTLRTPAGWLNYLSPEVIRALRITRPEEALQLPFTKQSDVYAFGTIWYELLCGDWPFPSSCHSQMLIWQVGQGIKPSLHAMTNTTKEAKDLLMKCWMFCSDERPSFSLLSGMLERLPKKRLTRSPSHPIQLSRSIDSFFRIID